MSENGGPLRLLYLLELERSQHEKTRKRLEKAEHDRERYKRRIRLLDGRHVVICGELRAAVKERDILRVALKACERSLMECRQGGQKKMQTVDSTSQSENTSPRENCLASLAHSISTPENSKGEFEKSPEDGVI